MRKNDEMRNFDSIKVAQKYAHTAQSEGTVTGGLVQGPRAPAGLELRPPAGREATGRGILGRGEGTGPLGLLRAVPF